MFLFGIKNTILVVGGMIIYHCLAIALCVFFAYKFLFVDYNASVFLLLIILIGPIIICDILAGKMQVLGRFLVRCRVDSEGIHCIFPGKRWSIKWADIHIFGITGFADFGQTGVVFFSTDLREKYQKDKLTLISSKRIVFAYNERQWNRFSIDMPDDIRNKLQQAISNTRDCYYRR